MKGSKYNVFTLLVISTLLLGGVKYAPSQIDPSQPLISSLNYRDYSGDSADHTILEGMQFKANSVKFTGNEISRVLETKLTFQNFEIIAPITVQTSCNYISATFDIALARYSLSVAHDWKDTARREFLRQIQSDWKTQAHEELHDSQYILSDKYLWFNSGRYVLYWRQNQGPSTSYLLYSSGKVIRITFDELLYGSGWGGESAFIDDNLLFKFSDTQISRGYSTHISPVQLMDRFHNGFFKDPPKP